VEPRIRNIFKKIGRNAEVQYAGRATAGSTATGYHKMHDAELQAFLKRAMS